jgi:acetolactate synthase-1/2/3 large subunit
VIGADAFQECDALGISRTITKWNVQVRQAAAVEATVRQAFNIAKNGRPGPVLVDFPKDIQLTKSPRFIHVNTRQSSAKITTGH